LVILKINFRVNGVTKAAEIKPIKKLINKPKKVKSLLVFSGINCAHIIITINEQEIGIKISYKSQYLNSPIMIFLCIIYALKNNIKKFARDKDIAKPIEPYKGIKNKEANITISILMIANLICRVVQA